MLLIAGRNMAQLTYLLRCGFIILIFTNLATMDKSTKERIQKHQEWLRQRNQQKANTLSALNYKTASFELANLWRFSKDPNVVRQKSHMNEVYPENETFVQNATTERSSRHIQQQQHINESLIEATIPTTITTALKSTSKVLERPVEGVALVMPIFTTTQATNDLANLNSFNVNLEYDRTTTATVAVAATTMAATTPTITTNTAQTTTTPIVPTTTTTTTKTTVKPKPKTRPYPRWGNWGKWNDCSRSCGGGVMYQQRKCISRNAATGKRFVSNDCIGLYQRYQLCNGQPCPTDEEIDFRAAQCAAYNEVNFQGHIYNWQPYIKDDAECELNCKPDGMKYFATLNETVIDGTPCQHSAEYYRSNYTSRAICVNGICKAVHATGAITGLYANSGSVSCGGLNCRPVTGLFTRDPLPEDAYVHVTTIPAGASNISITELKNSANLLVLRNMEQNYVFNGENAMSESGAYEAADAIFDYHRIDGLQHSEGVTEWITCLGPIRESLELLIYSKTLNPGIKYEYLLPITYDSEENELSLESDGFLKSGNDVLESSVSSSRSSRRRKFNWKIVGFSPCTKSCGGGTQSPIVRCARENPMRYYSQRRCMHAEKPVLNENLLRCNTQPCPAYWRVDDWGECRCMQAEGFRTREVSCVQELASGIVIHVDDVACMEEQPALKKTCECPKSARRRMHGKYRTHNGTHYQRSYRADKNAAVWLMSDWNQYCSTDCGPGVEYRTIFCDRTKQKMERCDSRAIPETTRPCERRRDCETGDWFAGPWTPCNGNCFNLTRSRQVLCIQNQLITDEEDCKAELKPLVSEKCSHEEVEYCAPRWHYSDWSQCTKSCESGTQRRAVKCLEYAAKDNALRESTKCRYSLREPIYRSCNMEKCEEEKFEQLQNDAADSCVDEFSNCKWAVQAKLCSYDYYRDNCCYSCGASV